MIESVINHITANPPPAGHQISFVRPSGTETLELAEFYDLAGRLALHLQSLDLRRGDRIGIVGTNSLEWALLDLAALRLGVQTAAFEPGKFGPEDVLVERYGLSLMFVEQPADHPLIRPIGAVQDLLPPRGAPPAITYAPEDVMTVKFTSGSTGAPKGLGATVGSIDASLRAVQDMFAHGPGDRLFVFLPLSLLQQRYWIYSALCFGHDITVATYEAAPAALRDTQPTVVMGVPAFYEAMKRGVEARAARGPVDTPVEDRLRAAVRMAFGNRIRYLWTGSAPASIDVLTFFTNVGLPTYEGYGLNETCIVTKNHPSACKLGSVGRVLPGKQVLLDADGVISVRSDHPVNRRYEYAEPGESERVFDADGMVRTGDLGYLDEEGYLFVRGRADDLIVLDSGKKVVVRPIEEHLRTNPAIEECVLYCPNRTYLVAVISPSATPPDTAAIAAQVVLTNAAFGPGDLIRRVVIARDRFSIDEGLLTSQFKPKRNAILDAYRAEIYGKSGGLHAT